MKASRTTPRTIQPGILKGELVAPPSKSISHRLLIMAALSGRKCQIDNFLKSEDTLITLHALQKMGFALEQRENRIIFKGHREVSTQPVHIDCGNSGTSARLLTAVAAHLSGEFVITGSPRMQQRPMRPLIDSLIATGAHIDHQQGLLPITVHGGYLKGGEVEIDASHSSQFISALMLVAPCTQQGYRIVPQGKIASIAYLELTAQLLKKHGIESIWGDDCISVAGFQKYQIDQAIVEGDYSNISYFVIGAALSGGEIRIKGLVQDSAQGDRYILSLAEKAGAKVSWFKDWVQIKSDSLSALDEDLNACPDLVPSLAVMALFSKGSSRFRNIGHLQYKESDRLAAIVQNIQKLGGRAVVENNDLIVQPARLRGTSLSSFNDHRIAMSFAMAGLRVPGIIIEDPACVEKSFPEFWHYLDQLTHGKS